MDTFAVVDTAEKLFQWITAIKQAALVAANQDLNPQVADFGDKVLNLMRNAQPDGFGLESAEFAITQYRESH